MDKFVKSTKPNSTAKSQSSTTRHHPYKSQQGLVKEKCTVPRPIGNIFTSSSTGHQVSQGAGGRSTTYFASRNLKLASQFKRPTSPLTDSTTTSNRDAEIFRN